MTCNYDKPAPEFNGALNEELLEKWLAFIKANPATSFVDLERLAKGLITVEGDAALFLPIAGVCSASESNVCAWAGVSLEFLAHTDELTRRGVYAVSDAYITYLIDGKTLSLPLVKTKLRKNPRKQMWLPMVFYFGTPPAHLLKKATTRG